MRVNKNLRQCDMCGKCDHLYRTNIEDTIINVCQTCSEHGKVLQSLPKKINAPVIKLQNIANTESLEMLKENLGRIVRNKREELKLDQDKLAKLVAEKVSIIHKIEINSFKPSIKLARKLERYLSIKLIDTVLPDGLTTSKSIGTTGLTIADMIKIKWK